MAKRKKAAPKIDHRTARLRLQRSIDSRIIYCGDCLEKLKVLPPGCVDLVYVDPPFFTGREHKILFGDPEEIRAFQDSQSSIHEHVTYMEERCHELARILTSTGSFYYHCDSHASHYIKVMLDRVFGYNNFRSEIIWKRTHAHGGAKRYGPVHDTILYYTASDGATWNPQYTAYSESYVKKFFRFHDDKGQYRKTILTGSGIRNGSSGAPWRGVDPTKIGRHWAIPGYLRELLPSRKTDTVQEALDQLEKLGRIEWPKKHGGSPSFKQYVDDLKGTPLQDIWTDIPPISPRAAEREGYPTQKPIPLLERIIAASSNPGDLVLDAFCGCGTTIETAEKMNRDWIGIDVSPTACSIVSNRIERECNLRKDEKEWKRGHGFWVRGLPRTENDLRDMNPCDFEDWAVIELDGIPNRIKVKDYGIDGRVYPIRQIISAGMGASGRQLSFTEDMFYPVQAKQKNSVGRPEVDAYETAMRRAKANRGFMVAFGFSNGALAEIRRAEREENLTIVPITVSELIKRGRGA